MARNIPIGELTVVKIVSWVFGFIIFSGGLMVHYFSNQASTREMFQEIKGQIQMIQYRVSALEGNHPTKPVAANTIEANQYATIPDKLKIK